MDYRQLAEVKMTELQKVVTGPLNTRPNLDQLVAEWGEYLRSEKSETTREAYLVGLRHFLGWCGDHRLDPTSVSPSHVRQWRDSLKEDYSAGTVNLRLSAVRMFYRWLVEQGAPILNPAAAVGGASRRGQTRRHKRSDLSSKEVLALLATCEDTPQGNRDHAILALMAYCALRTVEIHRADISDLDTRDGWPILWVRGKGKAEADDFVVLTEPVETTLQAWLEHRRRAKGPLFLSLSHRSNSRRLGLSHIRHMVKNRMRQVGIRNVRKTSHSLRHSAITTAIRKGASPLAVQAMARHRSFDTTLAYMHEVGRTRDPAERYIDYSAS
jgi:site-specific recombinase XerD